MNKKKILAILALAVSVSGVLSACSFGGEKAAEQVIIEETPTPEPIAEPTETPEPTIAPDAQQSTTYTSSDKFISIELPDATWANKTDESGVVSFESPSEGKILIVHGSGDAMNSVVIPDSEDMANSLEKASGLETGTDYQITGYTTQTIENTNVITYTVKYLNTEKSEGIVTTLNKFYVNDSEYVSVAASTYKDDADLLAKVQASEDSFRILGESTLSNTAAPSDGTDAAQAGTTGDAADPTNSSDTSANYTAEQLADTNQTRTVYRNSDGAPIVLTNKDGSWVDRTGNTYRFMDNGIDVYDQNDVDYYYGGEAGDVAFMPVGQ